MAASVVLKGVAVLGRGGRVLGRGEEQGADQTVDVTKSLRRQLWEYRLRSSTKNGSSCFWSTPGIRIG